MWRSVCALLAAAWFFAGLVFSLNPLVGLGLLALGFVDWVDIVGDVSPQGPRHDAGPPTDD